MSEVSNKTLASLLVLAIVASLGGTLLVLDSESPVFVTGFATEESGTVNLTIQGAISIDLTENTALNWGTVVFNTTTVDPICTLNSDGSSADGNNCTSYSSVATGMIIQNTGNIDVNVNMTSSDAAATFLGGTGDAFNYKTSTYTGNARGGCQTGAVASYTAVTTATQVACTNLTFGNTEDEMEVDFEVSVSPDTAQGEHSATLTFTGTTA